jgi:ferredoxin/flavodoxin
MNILICYFSGTGNTEWVSRRLCEALAAYGHKTREIAVEKLKTGPFEVPLCDMVGLLFPVLSGYAPPAMRNFIEDLSPAIQLPVFVITTSGYLSGDAAWFASRTLRRRGYVPFCLANVRMPNNLYFPPLNGLRVTGSQRIPKKLERASKKIRTLAGYIHQRKTYIEGAALLGRMLGAHKRQLLDKSEWWIKRSFEADETCNRCGWCVDHCPAQNIRLDQGGIRFLHRCTLCMRCFSFCPQKSIQITEKTKDRKRYGRYGGPENKPYGIDHSAKAPNQAATKES